MKNLNKLQKPISVLIMVVLLISCIVTTAACSREDEVITLVFMTIGDGGQTDASMVHEEFNRRLQDFLPGVEVEFIIVPSHEYAEQFELRMLSQTQIDVAWTGFAFSFAEQVQKGNYMQLDDLIDQNAIELRNETLPWMLDLGSVDGKLYQIPRLEWMNEWRMALNTPTDLFERYWDANDAYRIFFDNSETFRSMTPEMYDFLEEYLLNIKVNDDIQSGISFRRMSMNWGVFAYDSASAPVFRLPQRGEPWDFTVYNYYALPEVKLYYQKMAEFYNTGLIPRNIMDMNARNYENTRTNQSFIAWFSEYHDVDGTQFQNAIVGNDEQPYVLISLEADYYIARIESVSGHVIPTTSKHPEKAIQFIELLNTSKGKELFNILAFGIEDVHWRRVDENRIETLDYVGYPDDHSRYGLQRWSVGNVIANSYLTQSEPRDDYFDYMRRVVEEYALVSPLIGFTPDVRELQALNMAVQEVINEFEWPIGLGVLGDDWEQQYEIMISRMEEAGISQLVSELQRQVDTFLSVNNINRYGTIAE
jgi:putative aldouronate transport system substrate-binding protein